MKDLNFDGLEVLGTEEMSRIAGGHTAQTGLFVKCVETGLEWGAAITSWWNEGGCINK